VYYCSQTARFHTPLKNAFTEPELEQLHSENYKLLILCAWLGYTCKEAALGTGLTESTVETYRKRFKQFLGSRSSAAFAEFMKRNGML
jgi:DNA-binding NarL/FixJ family response regulator